MSFVRVLPKIGIGAAGVLGAPFTGGISLANLLGAIGARNPLTPAVLPTQAVPK